MTTVSFFGGTSPSSAFSNSISQRGREKGGMFVGAKFLSRGKRQSKKCHRQKNRAIQSKEDPSALFFCPLPITLFLWPPQPPNKHKHIRHRKRGQGRKVWPKGKKQENEKKGRLRLIFRLGKRSAVLPNKKKTNYCI